MKKRLLIQMAEHIWKSGVRCSLCVQFSSFSTVFKQQVSLSFLRMKFSVNSCGLLQFSDMDVTQCAKSDPTFDSKQAEVPCGFWNGREWLFHQAMQLPP